MKCLVESQSKMELFRNRCTRNKKSTIFLNSCKHLIFVKAKINKKNPVFDPRTDSQCFYLSCFSEYRAMVFGPLAIALTTILTFTPAAIVLDLVAGNLSANEE